MYLDHNATSPLLDEVLDCMRPWLGTAANPASVHGAGQKARVAVEAARDDVAALVGGRPDGVVFTSGATEGNHLFLRGCLKSIQPGDVVAVSSIEHACVLGAVEMLRQRGADVHSMGVDRHGVVTLGELPTNTRLISLMAANHETGVVQPVHDALAMARSLGAALHVDAVQAAGRIELALDGVDGVVLSSHKLGGPGGVGALILPNGGGFPALFTGGQQERGRRAGTVNTAGVVGFAAACRIALRDRVERQERYREFSRSIEKCIVALGGRIVGAEVVRVANTVCAVFPGMLSEMLVQSLDLAGVCVSAGAACSSGSLEPSPVLQAMDDPGAKSAIRVSLGPTTKADEVQGFQGALTRIVETGMSLKLDV